MAITYTPGGKKSWVLDTKKLRHNYYVQLAPDQEHIVLGSLQQGTRPPIGQWLQLGTIRRQLAGRYFVQQTRFNTLVPGVLIQSDTPPAPNWKDIQSQPLFHVIRFESIPYYAHNISDEYTFATSEEFIDEIVNPALDEIYPNRDQEEPVKLQLYYFRGRYTQFVNDITLLTPFNTPEVPTKLGYFLTDTDTYADHFTNLDDEPANLTIQPEAHPGTYSIILAVTNEDDEVIDYIFLEYVISYTLPA